MPLDVVPVPDVAMLDHLLARSHDAPVLLFNHDAGCGGSWRAYGELEALPVAIALVDVRVAHDVKRAIEGRLGVRHASPQAIVVRHGRAAWSASHGAIHATAIERALREAAAQDGRRDDPGRATRPGG